MFTFGISASASMAQSPVQHFNLTSLLLRLRIIPKYPLKNDDRKKSSLNRFWVPQTTIETSIIQPFLSFASRLGCLEHTVWDAYEAHNNRNLHFFLFTYNSVEVLSRSPRKEFCFRQNFPQGKLHCSSSTSNFDFNSHLSSQIPLYGLSVSPVLPKLFPCMPK